MRIKIFHILYLMLILPLSIMGQVREVASAFTDKDCYVVGERMHVKVCITDSNNLPTTTSRVAYVELSDTAALQAQGMALLADGQGWIDLALPSTLHSGYYMLTVYTRQMCQQGAESFHRQLVGVVNPMHVSRRDNIKYHAPKQTPEESVRRYTPGQAIMVSVPSMIQTLSVVRHPLVIQSYEPPQLQPVQMNSFHLLPEVEGHIIAATTTGEKAEQTKLSGVGKRSFLVDGQPQNDSLWCFYTHGMTGHLPIVLEAIGNQGFVPIQLKSPFVGLRPCSLPTLDVWCSEQELLERAKGAQREEAISQWLEDDTLRHSIQFLSQQPDRFYDMDEYTRLNTVKEAMVEFIQGVDRRKVKGVPTLFTQDPHTGIFSKLPAMVLLDGMPVSDIDRLMSYDARLLKYVQVYNDNYTFGSTTYNGVISFISRRGLLSNFQLEEGNQMVRYAFPQDHPSFVISNDISNNANTSTANTDTSTANTDNSTSNADTSTSTLLWNPAVNAKQTRFAAPSHPGRYRVTLQGIDPQGIPFKSMQWIEVE